MCDNPKNIWTPDTWDEDSEELPRGLYRADLTAEYSEDREIEFVGTTMQPTKIARAILAGKGPNLIGSKIHRDFGRDVVYHAPLLDLDQKARVKKTSTRGHHHLILDQYVPEREYKKAMDALSKAGMVQRGFSAQIEKFGQTFVRWNALKEEE